MNRKILCAPLKFPAGCFSPQAKSLLRGLLERDPKRRLGSGPSDFEELKAHPFFASIEWDKLFRKEIEPMFKPHLVRSCLQEGRGVERKTERERAKKGEREREADDKKEGRRRAL